MNETERQPQADAARKTSADKPEFPGLVAIESISILGDHDGIMPDDLLEILEQDLG